MILVFSQNDDQSTLEVCKWLDYLGYDNCVFSKEDAQNCLVSKSLEGGTVLSFKNKDLSLSKVKAIWYRRGGLSSSYPQNIEISDPNLKLDILYHLYQEMETLNEFVISTKFTNISSLGSSEMTLNKLDR